MTSETWVGKSVQRVDGSSKVRGKLEFSSDVYAEGMLHCRPVLAPYPHAKINAVHAEEALAVPGVVRVLTASDVPGVKNYSFFGDREVLCEKTRYIGDMVAVVVAETEMAAEIGIRKVHIDYEPLTVITDPARVINGDYDVQVHDKGNILKQIHFTRGEIENVFERDDLITLERTYNLQMMDHAFLETESGVAFPENGGVRVISGSQGAFYDRSQVAQCLGLPDDKVRMVEPQTGGAFGGKANISVQIVVALAALLTGKPCRMAWTRKEHFLAGVKRHPLNITLKTSANKEGDLIGLKANIVVDTGAYGELGEVWLDVVVENITGPYTVPNVKIDAWLVHTNNATAGAFRGLGAPEACMAIESQMSQMARRLGIDPITFRKRNLLKQGDTHGSGHVMLLPVGTVSVLETAFNHSIWRNRDNIRASSEEFIKRGVGVAIGMKGYSLGIGDAEDYGSAIMELAPNGRIQLKVGALECGQGSHTVLTQIAAETFKCPMDMIDLIAADTSECLDAGLTAASRITFVIGRAINRAAEELTKQILEVATEETNLPADRLVIERGLVLDPLTGKELTLDFIAEAAGTLLKSEVIDRVPLSEQPATGALDHPHVLYSSMTQVAQVAVDIETGEIRVERVVCFPDIGKAINPKGVEGQCEGGVAQGLGYALMEQVYVENGVVINPHLATYPTPTSCDVPLVETILVEVPEANGPFGAKGIGENATVPTAPAILNAIEDAIGIRFTAMPVTPERVIEALTTQ